MEPDRAPLVRAALKETDWLYQVWDAVRDARCEYYYVTVRRQSLKRLQTMLGADAYSAADLPPGKKVSAWALDAKDAKLYRITSNELTLNP